MSSICDDLRAAILQAAMQGRLTGTADEDWNESKIEDVCELSTGNSISESIKKSKYMKVSEGRNYIGTKDLGFDHSFNYENGVKIPLDENNFRIANSGDILLCIEGGSAGRKIGILEEDVNYGNKLCRFSPNGDLNNRFLFFYIQSPLFQEQFSDSMTGIIGGVSIKKIKAIPVKYPSITEQKRIVEKVDELMARVADLEQSTDTLASLKKAFPDDIKASLLQAAMQGKLTKQLPEDGSAEDLLDKIKAEKEKLIAEGKIKKQKPLAPITDDEIPFSIPNNWKWAYIPEACYFQEGPGILAKDFRKNGTPLIRIAGMQGNIVSLEGCNYLDPEMVKEKWSHFKLDEGDIVISTSASLDKIAEVDVTSVGAIPYTGLIRFKMFDGISKDFFKYFIESPFYVSQIKEQEAGAAIKHYGPTHLNHMLMPIPPLAEQKRIVERLNTFMQNINVVGDLIAGE